MTRKELIWLACILGVGAALRVWYLADFSQGPDFASPGVDAEFHDYWARGLATGDWAPPPNCEDPKIQSTPFLRPPGYPYFLAAIYRAFGTSYLAPRVVQMAMGLASAFVAFVVARNWFGFTAGVVTSALMASYWGFIYFEAEFHAPVLMIFLTLLMVYAMGRWAEQPRWGWLAAAGVLFGLSALVLPNVLLFAPFAAFWIVRLSRHATALSTAPGLRQLAVFAAASAAAIAPATIRNYRVSGEFIPITTNAGINLYIGNHEGAEGFCLTEIPELGRFETCFDYPQLVRNLEQSQGRKFTHKQVDDYFESRAVQFIISHPAEFLRITLRKALMFWGPSEISHNKEDALERRYYTALHAIPLSFAMMVVLAIAGLGAVVSEITRARKLRGKREVSNSSRERSIEAGFAWRPISTAMAMLLIFYVAAFFLSILPFFNAGRYRVPIVPPLMILGAIGVSRCGAYFRKARRKDSALVFGSAVLGIFAMAFWPFTFEPDLSNWHYSRGVCLARTNRPDDAIREYEAAVRVDPANAKAHYNLGMLLQQKGRAAEAAAHLDAVSATGYYADETRLAKAQLLANEGRLDEAAAEIDTILTNRADDVKALMLLAGVREKQGLTGDAVVCYRRVLEKNPDDADVHYNLGVTLAVAGRHSEAIESFRSAIEIRPEFFAAWNNMGASLVQLNQYDGALTAFGKALEIDPASREAVLNLTYTLSKQSMHEKVIELLSEWVKTHPDDGDAHLRLGDALAALNRKDEAAAHYNAVLKIYPGNEAARRRLAEMGR